MILKRFFYFIFFVLIFYQCIKKVGSDPEQKFSDKALFDSAKSINSKYYKNKDTLYSGAHGPHGTFKLRFNSAAYKMLTDSGRIPKTSVFPEGAMVVKDVYKNGTLDLYAYMYKHNGLWLWGEAQSTGKFLFTVKDGPGSCLGCHSQSGNRDFVVAFNFY